jgi:hypothetical protein
MVLALAALAVASGCDSSRTPMVAETDDIAADFGRSALIEAVVILSKSPKSPEAFLTFTKRVDELTPFFSRAMKREAELRVCVLAIGPLQANFDAPPVEQMENLGVTVWPAVLQIPVQEGETSSDYVARLCEGELAVECHNVVPEFWPFILNARVWRTLKSRINVAYDRCQWCADDPDFGKILETSRTSHQIVESLAKDARAVGNPRHWPTAGKFASPKSSNVALSFAKEGWVTVQNRRPEDGDWRSALVKVRQDGARISIHVTPEKEVQTLLDVIVEARAAGFKEATLATRKRPFPYELMEYSIRVDRVSFQDLGVRPSDTVQVLVQALDYRVSKKKI